MARAPRPAGLTAGLRAVGRAPGRAEVTGLVMGGGRVRVRYRSKLTRAAPGAVVGATGMLAVATGVPAIGLLSAVTLPLLAPWARTLAVRAMLGLLLVLAAASLALAVPTLRWSMGSLVLLLAGLTALQATVALVRAQVPLVPRLGAADAVALIGGVLTVAMLGAPYVGRSGDDILLELARGFDSVNHVLAVTNLVVEQGAAWAQPGWPSPDGSGMEMAGYPLGFHAAIAGALGLAGVGPSRDLVVGYAWATVLALGACAALLGWVAVRIALPLGSARTSTARATWAALGYAACVLLGGSLVAPFVLGHAPFLVAATAGIGASFLALELLAGPAREDPPDPRSLVAWERSPGACEVAALAVLAVGAIGLVGAYPPLACGLVPAGVAWVWHGTEPSSRRRLRPLAISGITVALLAILWLWRGRIEHLVTAVGENSTPFVVSTVLVVLTAGAAWVAWERGWGLAPARALAVAAGNLGAALVLALAAVARGLVPSESYYGTKLAEAAWLAGLPVLVALVAAALLRVSAAMGRGLHLAAPGVGIAALAVIMGALPVGRQDAFFVGPATLAQRLLEARRAEGQVRIVLAARLAGPSAGDASAIIEPDGWFYPVAHENAPAPHWRREAGTAGLWLATLRGPRTQATDQVAACFPVRGGPDSLDCVDRWLAAEPQRRITLVVTTGPNLPQVQAWVHGREGRVRIVVLPPPAPG